MVVCNTCGTVGVWEGTTILNPDGSIHKCLEELKRKYFKYHGLDYEYIEDGCEPDPKVPRQVRLEGNTWTLYHHGKVFKVIERKEKK